VSKLSFSRNPDRVLGKKVEYRKKSTIAAGLAIIFLFLISGLVASPRAFAFANGQSASIVLGQPNFVLRNVSTTQNGLNDPYNIAFDSHGDLWVADASNSRILEFAPPFSTDEAASIVLGVPNFTSTSDVCFATTVVNPSCLDVPQGLAFDSSGDLWVSDTSSNRILEFTTPFSNGENASMVLGMENFTTGAISDTPPSQSDLDTPWGLTFDSSGNLWVADSGYNRVLEFKTPFSIGEAASTVLGQDNFTAGINANYPGCALGQACPTASSLQDPSDVKFDSSGDLWVADTTPFRILEFKAPFSNGMSASLVLGEPDFTTYRSGSVVGCEVVPSASCTQPYALAFAKSGTLWVADADFSRVLAFNPPFTNDENASIVLGQPNFTSSPLSGTQNATATDMSTPTGIALDPSGNVWVSDSTDNRVLEFSASTVGSSTSSSSSSSTSTSVTSSSSTSTSHSISSTTIIPPTTSTASTQSATPVVTSSSHASSSSSSTSITPNYLAVVAVVGVVMVGTFVLVRRRGSPTRK